MRRGLVAVIALLFVTAPVAGVVSGIAGSGQGEGESPVPDAAARDSTVVLEQSVGSSEDESPDMASDGRFASDAATARVLGPPESAANATVTATGGSAWARGTDDVVDGAPLSISATQRVALTPERPGEVQVTHVFEIPGSVASLETSIPEGATVTGRTGFTPSAGDYEWNGDVPRARITYTVAVNETVSKVGPEGAAGRYLLVDAGEWALVRRPDLSVRWSWDGPVPVGLDRQTAVAGAGYAGEEFAYLGAVDTHERRAHGQTFTLVVPDRATMAESPDAVLDALADSSDRLRVGDRDERVTMFVAPTTSVEWGVRGLQYGDSDAWVRDAEPLGEPDNTWVHEYVHTRQSFRTASSGEWLPEATATYYAALLALERGETEFPAFRSFLGRGARAPQSGSVLVEPRSWDNAANYWKGALVTAAIDRRIRLATNGTRSFGTVFSRLNAYPNPVDWTVTLELIERVGGDSVDQFAGTYITTSRVPSAWSAAEHEAAFGTTPARFTYRFADRQSDLANATDGGNGTADPDRANATVGFAVSGPYRNGTVEGSSLTLYTGETLHATGVVTNAGGANASYEQFFSVGGSVERTVSGTLVPGETAVHALNYTANTTGSRTVSFGAETVAVEVYDPAPASLGDVVANRTTLQGPGVVGLNVTVVNPHDTPARLTVTVTRDGEGVWTGLVGVPAGGTRTVTVPVRLDFSGQYVVGVADGPSTRITVGASANTPSPTDRSPGSPGTSDDPAATGDPEDDSPPDDATDVGGTAGSGPGFGAVATLLAAVLTALVLGRRSSS